MSALLAHIRIPGAFWLALIAFVAAWLPELAPGAPWLDEVLLILLALLKAVEVVVKPPPEIVAGARARDVADADDASDAVLRWLVG